MNIEIPLYKQQKDNTCALACLRMVLAEFGANIEEGVLESQAHMEDNGILIDELQRLAQQQNLVAELMEPNAEQLRDILAAGRLPIAYIDRAVFDLTPLQRRKHSIHFSRIHCVIPTRVTAKSVTFFDPRPPSVTRKSIRLFRRAYESLGSRCVVCSKPEVPS